MMPFEMLTWKKLVEASGRIPAEDAVYQYMTTGKAPQLQGIEANEDAWEFWTATNPNIVAVAMMSALGRRINWIERRIG
jgi:hypothetical protein